jgi:hypothetical protein
MVRESERQPIERNLAMELVREALTYGLASAETAAGETDFKQGDGVRLIWPRSAMVTMEEGA